ncbi:hypothetical protein VZT92_025557 [Zoarces viviparus]|uniref:Uncharacterized protein n=1 Tax=Zoarces viviparus TaxID=48416 RepID=A0AAW1DXL3_ZOAVI
MPVTTIYAHKCFTAAAANICVINLHRSDVALSRLQLCGKSILWPRFDFIRLGLSPRGRVGQNTRPSQDGLRSFSGEPSISPRG